MGSEEEGEERFTSFEPPRLTNKRNRWAVLAKAVAKRITLAKVLQLCHFVFSTSVVAVWLVEFALPPPFYDSFPTDGRYKTIPSTDEVTAGVSPYNLNFHCFEGLWHLQP